MPQRHSDRSTKTALGVSEARYRSLFEDQRRATRALHVLSGSHHAMQRAEDESQLLREVCSLVSAAGMYRLACVAMDDPTDPGAMRPVAWAGLSSDYINGLTLRSDDSPHGRGPIGTAAVVDVRLSYATVGRTPRSRRGANVRCAMVWRRYSPYRC